MMVRPDPIPRTAQYFAPKNSKTEANENINVVGLDSCQFIAVDVVGIFPASRVHLHHLNAGEKLGSIDCLERVRQDAGFANQDSLDDIQRHPDRGAPKRPGSNVVSHPGC